MILPHFACRAHFEYSWVEVCGSSEGLGGGEGEEGIYDDRLQFMAGDDALNLEEALGDGMCLVPGMRRRLPLLTHTVCGRSCA